MSGNLKEKTQNKHQMQTKTKLLKLEELPGREALSSRFINVTSTAFSVGRNSMGVGSSISLFPSTYRQEGCAAHFFVLYTFFVDLPIFLTFPVDNFQFFAFSLLIGGESRTFLRTPHMKKTKTGNSTPTAIFRHIFCIFVLRLSLILG